MNSFKILFFGDIVGSIGRRVVRDALPGLREKHSPDFVIANVENLAHGRGITAKTLQELDAAGIDAYTSGNHVWENPTGLACFDDPRWNKRLVRPANVPPDRAGVGWTVIEKNETRLLLINLMGQLFMKDTVSSPFLTLDRILREAPKTNLSIVDIHAETTSEKEALGHYADGRVHLVLGTHTHVPTADAKILPGGTGYITDVGRNGAWDSVVGFEKKAAISRFLDPQAHAYDPPVDGPGELNAVVSTINIDTGKIHALDHLHRII